MEDTIRRMMDVLGGQGMESLGRDRRFVVDGKDGSRCTIMMEMAQQRFIADLYDGHGALRSAIDIGPVSRMTESPDQPGRVTLHVGALAVHLDVNPRLAITVASAPS